MRTRTHCFTDDSGERSFRIHLLAVAILALLQSAWLSASVVQFFDTEFDDPNWNLSVVTAGGGGTVLASQVAAGGNPGAYRSVTIQLVGGSLVAPSQVLGFHARTGAVYDPSTQGAIETIDYFEDARLIASFPGAAGPATGPAVRQNGKIYVAAGLAFAGENTWTSKALIGLVATDFFEVLPGVTPNFFAFGQNPDFSETGAPMTVGFFRWETHTNAAISNRVAGIDNWEVTIYPKVIGDGTSLGVGSSVGDNTTIGDNVDVRDNVVIEDGAKIGADAFIGKDASIGDSAFIGVFAKIGQDASVGDGADIGEDAQIGEGAVCGGDGSGLGENTVVGFRTLIGANSPIGENSVLGSDAVIGDDSPAGQSTTIGSQVLIENGVTIGDEVTIGSNAIIEFGAVIEDRATIAWGVRVGQCAVVPEGAVALSDVPAGVCP